MEGLSRWLEGLDSPLGALWCNGGEGDRGDGHWGVVGNEGSFPSHTPYRVQGFDALSLGTLDTPSGCAGHGNAAQILVDKDTRG